MNLILLIVVISSLVLIGIVSFVFELHAIRKTQQKIIEFRDKAVAFYTKLIDGKDANKEWTYILANYKNVSRLMSPHCYQPSTYDLVTSAMNNNRLNLENDVACLDKEVVSTVAEYDLDFKNTLSQWWNIFSYFFRGIGTLLRIVFQYPIKLINPDFDFKSKGWNVFCAIVGLIGSAASIASLFL